MTISSSIGRFMRTRVLGASLVTLAIGVAASPAQAQDRVYWSEGSSGSAFAYAALDGSGGGSLGLEKPGTKVGGPFTVDTADGRLFWFSANNFESMRFDGTDQRSFDTGGVALGSVHGMSIDPLGRRLIWSASATAQIKYAALDGGGGGGLSAPGLEIATGGLPAIFDPASQRVYWVDPNLGQGIGYAAIDGSGGAVLPVPDQPGGGIAVDEADGRIYFVAEEKKLMSMRLDGSDLRPLDTGTATLVQPWGLAIDEAAGTVYWTNKGAHAISFAKLDGSSAGQVNIAGSPPGPTDELALFVAPRPVAPPTVSGAAAVGQTLTCSTGGWEPDQPQARLFDAAVSFGYQWTRDGSTIDGATGPTLTVPSAGASYGCTVAASNGAGATAAASDPVQVPAPPPPATVGFGAATAVMLALSPGHVRGNVVGVTIENFNPFAVGGSLSASATVKTKTKTKGARGKPRRVPVPAQAFEVGAGSTTATTLRLPAPLRKQLLATGKVRLNLAATVADPLGTRREVAAPALIRRATSRKGGKRGIARR
jgi:hypothetical protein